MPLHSGSSNATLLLMEPQPLTYANVQGNPDLLVGLHSKAEVAVACSRCGASKQMMVFRVRRALTIGQSGFFCSKSCRSRHTYESKLDSGDRSGGHVCAKCGVWKSLGDYPHSPSRKGRTRTCTLCVYHRPRRHYQEYKRTSQRRSHPFDLTFEDFMRFWRNPCHYCGGAIPTIGLDRVDNDVGYQIDNVVSCCEACNKMKHLDTYEGFLSRCRDTARRHPC
jgi:hypothetical protein